MENSLIKMFDEEHTILYNEEVTKECMQLLKDTTKQMLYPLVNLNEADFTWKIIDDKRNGKE